MTRYIHSTEGPVVYPSSRRRLHRVGALAVTALITPQFLVLPLATAVEDKWGVAIPDEELANIKTVGDAMKFIENNQ